PCTFILSSGSLCRDDLSHRPGCAVQRDCMAVPRRIASRLGEGLTFNSFIIGAPGFVAGAGVTYFAAVFGTLVVWCVLGAHDQAGGGSMALGLIFAPICAVVGGIVGAFLLPAWIARRRRNAPPPTDESRARDQRRFAILGGAIV